MTAYACLPRPKAIQHPSGAIAGPWSWVPFHAIPSDTLFQALEEAYELSARCTIQWLREELLRRKEDNHE